MTELKDKKRLADALAGAGLDTRRVAMEVLYLLPTEFIRTYEAIFHEAISLGDEGSGTKADRDAELGRAKGSGAHSSVHSRKNSVFPVKDLEAFQQKEWIDRKLRSLTRQIKKGAGLPGLAPGLKCGWRVTEEGKLVRRERVKGCGKYLEEAWKFCPSCGLARAGQS